MKRHHFVSVLTLLTAGTLLMGTAPLSMAQDILSATPTTIAGATLAVTTPTASSPLGVSPDVAYDATTGTYFLLTTSNPAQEYRSPDGITWTPVSDATLPMGFDWTIVTMGPQDYRLYYASINPNAPSTVSCSKQRKELHYATSTDLIHWTSQPGTLLSDVGCGVPHVLRRPDGGYLLYYNTITTAHGIHIATSPDGLTWTTLPGLVANDSNLVDPSPIVMPDGTYLMLASTMGAGTTQALQILSSADGLNWTHRKSDLYAPSGYSVLDPSLKNINGQLRVWFGYAPGNNHAESRIATGVLTLGPVAAAAKPVATAAKPGGVCTKAGAKATYKGKALVCQKVKGKLIWVRSSAG